MTATNKTDLAVFVVNSFDLCIQICVGLGSSTTPASAVYHWQDGTEDTQDRQRPGTCWCEGGDNQGTTENPMCDTAIARLS